MLVCRGQSRHIYLLYLRPCRVTVETVVAGASAGEMVTFSSNSIAITEGLVTTTPVDGWAFSLFSSSPELPPVD